jgi:alkanesulfonate monooxygenase SsuD/methylene tetrahydromethanopterin reductase-like flavin-dependent oxidoreductase (luciferase family)
VRFGTFLINEKPPGGSDATVLRDSLEQCRLADELGYDVIWLGEHHFAPYGTMPDTMVFAAALSQITRRIQIGTAVIVPAFQHPIRVAEQVAMLDHLSNGRFVLGLGRGYQQREFQGFGIPQAESTARFREAIVIIEGLLANEAFTHEGKFWQVSDLSLAPRPAHDIPIYVAVSKTPDSFHWAAEHGYGIMVGNPYAIDAGTGDGQRLYVETQQQAGRAVSMAHTWGLMNSVFVHESAERARELFRQSWQIGNDFLWRYARVVEEGQDLPADYKHYAGWYDWIQHAEYDKIFDNPWTLVGSPDEIVERLHAVRELQTKFGPPIDKYILWMNRGGCIAQQEVMRSMELFATKVMPQVRDL